MTSQDHLDPTAGTLLGDRALRPFQRETCEALLTGRDVLLVAPTGAGKSLCYQLATRLTGKPTLVLSPLIALMDDQATGSNRLGLRAGCLHSGIEASQQWATLAGWIAGTVELLYTSPERLRDPRVLAALDAKAPGLVVIDEAHCISTWGRRFRPAYRQVGGLARQRGGTPVLAMTATARAAVQQDIAENLGLREYLTVTVPLALTNVKIEAVHAATAAERTTILRRLATRGDLFPMVVFCVLKKHCEGVAAVLRDCGLETLVYHAGIPVVERAKVSEAFHQGGGRKVLVATSAYEMGVNVPGIRSVVHYGLPTSLESYLQGIGRAGRDGRGAAAILMYSDADLDILDSLEGLGARACTSKNASEDQLDLAAQEVYAFALTRSCRKAFLRTHLHPGTQSNGWCGRCDNCEALDRPGQTREVDGLIRAMKAWRQKAARDSGQPAFTLFTDLELIRIARHRPTNPAELNVVPGIRRPSLERYGAELIAIVQMAATDSSCFAQHSTAIPQKDLVYARQEPWPTAQALRALDHSRV